MSQQHLTGVRCLACGDQLRRVTLACPSCSARGSLETIYDLDEVGRSMDRESLERREPWMWRFRELLPHDELAELPPLQVGLTPLFGAPRLAQWLGVHGLWIKDEGRNPTGSIHDRLAALAVTAARESGRKRLVRACRGAEGLALACLAASVGLDCALVASDDADAAALAQAHALGARVVRTSGSFDAALALSHEAAEALRMFDANSDHPALADGLKTLGLEIAEQLCERMPDWVALACDDGFAVAAVARGLREMQELRVVRTAPKLLGVEGDAGALRAALAEGPSATGAVGRAAAAVEESRGAAVGATRDQIDEARRELARAGAVLAGPSGALAAAGVREAARAGTIGDGETVVLVCDGGPLAAAARPAVAAAPIAPTIDALKAALQ